eukprot:INCI11333.2.p1 GENE.INCI11333.2~~INCI11333.2.p1  ORF type:complete len:111 (-),score=7.22 INCI11333.2:44-376(-)
MSLPFETLEPLSFTHSRLETRALSSRLSFRRSGRLSLSLSSVVLPFLFLSVLPVVVFLVRFVFSFSPFSRIPSVCVGFEHAQTLWYERFRAWESFGVCFQQSDFHTFFVD